MEKSRVYEVFYNQMAADYSCTLDEIKSFENLVKVNEFRPKRRLYKEENYIAKLVSLNGKFVLCVDEKIYDEAKELISVPGEWMSLGQSLDKLNQITSKYGYMAMDQHHYYLPVGVNAISDDQLSLMMKEFKITWYERDELEQFRGDSRFTSALTFCENAPDMLAVTAEKDGQILGMSGASADSETMWQIGINVMKEARGMNIGPLLTILIKNEILKRGKLCFYGTAESHIQSQRVAIKSGFFPSWWEAYSYKKKSE